MTLARLTGIPALKHGVFTNGKVRFSAPFFQRVATYCTLPDSPGHPMEKVSHFNRRLRDAENDELRSNGNIVLAQRRKESRERHRVSGSLKGKSSQSNGSRTRGSRS